jgi:hypothetical protein
MVGLLVRRNRGRKGAMVVVDGDVWLLMIDDVVLTFFFRPNAHKTLEESSKRVGCGSKFWFLGLAVAGTLVSQHNHNHNIQSKTRQGSLKMMIFQTV